MIYAYNIYYVHSVAGRPICIFSLFIFKFNFIAQEQKTNL